MTEVFFLAIALSMDAFAVSIGLGSRRDTRPGPLALKAALYFGLSQGLMPVIGYLAGKGVLGWIETLAPWIACGLLVLIGGKMIYEACAEGIETDLRAITHRVLLVLAIATSIDAMAAGFTLTLLDMNPLAACVLIGVTTFMFSVLGVYIGHRSGTWLESRAEVFGGIVLIFIGFRILFT